MTTSRWRKTAAETIAYVIRRDGHLKTNAIRLKEDLLSVCGGCHTCIHGRRS